MEGNFQPGILWWLKIMWRFFDIFSLVFVVPMLLQLIFDHQAFIGGKLGALFFLTGAFWLISRFVCVGLAWSWRKIKKLPFPKQMAVMCGVLFLIGLGFGLGKISS